MGFWSELGGGVKAVLVVGVLLALSLGAYQACTTPSAEDERKNAASRAVN